MPVYNAYKKTRLDETESVDLVNDTIKVALMADTYTPDIDADAHWDDVSADEASGTNYTAGGNALASKAVTQDNANDRAAFDADDVNFANVTITARYAVLYKDTGVPGTSTLIGYYDFGSNKSATAADFVIQWDAAGLLLLT